MARQALTRISLMSASALSPVECSLYSSLKITKALINSPRAKSGDPTAADSSTAGWVCTKGRQVEARRRNEGRNEP